jgi:hypothetical protein
MDDYRVPSHRLHPKDDRPVLLNTFDQDQLQQMHSEFAPEQGAGALRNLPRNVSEPMNEKLLGALESMEPARLRTMLLNVIREGNAESYFGPGADVLQEIEKMPYEQVLGALYKNLWIAAPAKEI